MCTSKEKEEALKKIDEDNTSQEVVIETLEKEIVKRKEFKKESKCYREEQLLDFYTKKFDLNNENQQKIGRKILR